MFVQWCRRERLDPCTPTVPVICDFLTYLFVEKELAVSTITGYRSCLSQVLASKDIDISADRDLNQLIKNFHIERPRALKETPAWDLMIVLRRLMKPPHEPMMEATMADITRKTAFLLTLATAKRNSEVWAFNADIKFGQNYSNATLSFLPMFMAKTMVPGRPETYYAPVTIPALAPTLGRDMSDRFLCPVRALRIYLDKKHNGNDPSNKYKRLLRAHDPSHKKDISKSTVSGWVKSLIIEAYRELKEDDVPFLTHTNFQAREIRALASSLAFHHHYSLTQVMSAASWRNSATFPNFYLRELSSMGDITQLGGIVAAQTVVPSV